MQPYFLREEPGTRFPLSSQKKRRDGWEQEATGGGGSVKNEKAVASGHTP